MDHFAGLDVSVKETSICIVDDAGKIVREVKVASEPEALLAAPSSVRVRVHVPPQIHYSRCGANMVGGRTSRRCITTPTARGPFSEGAAGAT